MNTQAVFFPFDLFGSAGTRAGAELLADAFEEMLEDNERESIATRARAYMPHVRMKQLPMQTLPDHVDWRDRARRAIRPILRKKDFLLWITGNHLGVLPFYDELSQLEPGTTIIQLDAHLDIYNLSDCTSELSHGNFLLHCDGALPEIINIGTREQLLRPQYVRKYYAETFPAVAIATHWETVLDSIRKKCSLARRIVLDIDCDVFEPSFFPAVSNPLPFGLTPQQVLQVLDAAWSGPVAAIAVSEFDPGRDRHDQSLALLVWLLEHILLRIYEPQV